uniref:RNA helicase n=1 Tax=Hemiscolopendra marginata TaxID=943146 RepID=A0A646QG28_9MYRI
MTDVDWARLVQEQERRLTSKIESLNLADSKREWKKDDSLEKKPEINEEENEEQEVPAAESSLIRKILRSTLVQSTHDIEIQRKDPNSPLYSVKSFEELHLRPNLLKGVYAMGFNSPSKIQETALPTLLADPPQNMIAQSQSGTGKTAAFVLAMLSRVDSSKPYPQVLCLSPTYELALQTGNVAKQMAQFCPDIKIRYAVRGEEVPRGEKLKEHIIIGTPGKVLDWTIKFKFFDIKLVRVFVLDEADVMIATQGHQDQSIRIHKNLDKDCQMMLFSATYDSQVMNFAEAIIHYPVIIRLRREEESLENIKQFYVVCKNMEEKYTALDNIYGVISIGQAMIFCHTRKTAQWLVEKMVKQGHAVALLSGDLTVEQRIAVLDRFRKGTEKVLITTNVCARGIDVEQVTVVVNFDIPTDAKMTPDFETYLHRIGRTGRFGKAGIAINMVDGPKSRALLKQIEDHFGREILKLDAEDVDEIEKIAQD